MVRQAGLQDLHQLLQLSEAFHKTTGYKDIEFETDTVTELILRAIDQGGVFVNDGGFILGFLVPLSFNHNVRVAAEFAWYCPEGDGSELKDAFIDWALESGAFAVQFSSLVNGYTQKIADILAEDSFVPVEVSYLRKL